MTGIYHIWLLIAFYECVVGGGSGSNAVSMFNRSSGNTGDRLLNHILAEVTKGHVTRDRISHWMTEIHDAVDKGSLNQTQMDEFMVTVQNIYSSQPDSGTCCPFG